MLKNAILLVAILLQIALFSVAPVAAGVPEPSCFPCSVR